MQKETLMTISKANQKERMSKSALQESTPCIPWLIIQRVRRMGVRTVRLGFSIKERYTVCLNPENDFESSSTA